MKTLIHYSLILALLVLVGCVQTPDEALDVLVDNYDAKRTVNIEGAISHVVTTRATDRGFADGDKVGIYVVNYDNGKSGTLLSKGNHADNVRYMFDYEEYRWIPEYDVYFKDDNTHVDLFGYYPYADPSSVTEYPFEVERKQNIEPSHGQMGGYEASDFLWSSVTNVAPTEKRIKMTFYHRMAGVYVTLVEGSGWAEGEWALLKKEVLVKNTVRKSNVNLSTGVVTPIGEKPNDDIIPYVDGYNFRAVVVPQNVSSGTSLFSITVDGIPYNYKYKVNGVPTDFTYVSGKMHKFTLEVSKKEQTGVEFKDISVSITAWEADNASHQNDAKEYIVVHCPYPGQLERTMTDRMEMDVTAINNLKVTGKIGGDDYTFMRDKMTSLMRLNLKEVESVIDGVYQIPADAFSRKTTLVKCIFPDRIESIGTRAFGETSLTGAIILPEGLKYVSGFNNTKITNVQFPSTLEIIGGSKYGAKSAAFEGCSSLICEINLPHSIKEIGDSAFENAGIIGNLTLPESLEYIGQSAFYGCDGLTGSLTIPKGIKVINKEAFCRCGFTGNLNLPLGLTEVQSYAFEDTKFKGELNIPETVLIIGDGAFRKTEFSGNLILPDGLIQLGASTFYGCWRLSGVIEIPENIAVISSELFKECSAIEGVVLHKFVQTIESNAFYNCFYISSIICDAKTPPTIASGAFNGVPKDNFVIEVPDASVKLYQNSSGWREFKRIEAQHEFSISRNLLRTLNAERSKTLVVRALTGEEWSVESCPEWVTVTPSSGVGKTEVVVTVRQMEPADIGTFEVEKPRTSSSSSVQYTTHNGRSGEIVFLLDEKGFRTSMTVEQFDYEYDDGDLITHQTAAIGNGVNIVLIGDCFDAKDISEGKYRDAMNDAYLYFFDIEPYNTYKDYFNVYSVFGLSFDSGMGTHNTIREARFGSQYTLEDGVSPDFETIFAAACIAPINDNVARTLIIMVENSSEYDGLCYMWGDGSAVAIVPMSTDPAPYDFRGLIHHEAGGHGFGKLADEYIYHNQFISSCKGCGNFYELQIEAMKEYGFYDNVSLSGSMYDVPWSHMIFDSRYSNVVDIYEGAYMHSRGVYRSEATSCMNNNIPYYNAISREAMVKRIMKYAGEDYSFEAFKSKDVESLPSVSTRSLSEWEWGGSNVSSRFGQHIPKFMGETPSFKKTEEIL